VLTESQVIALEKAKTEKEAHGEFESEHPGYCGAQDTFYVGNLKGVGRIYQQTFIDTYAKVAFAKLYDRKTPITAAELLNDRVVPFFEEHDVKLLRVLTDRGSEYCGNPERHEYELYLAVEDIDHSRTKTKSPQTNGICERFHKTVLNEFYRVAFRKKVYRSIDELQADLDAWITEYNGDTTTSRPLVLRQNADADIPGCNANDEGEDDRSLTVSDTKPDRLARHQLSDRVPANTDHFLLRYWHCVKECLHWRFSEAPAALMWPRLIVVAHPQIEIGLQLVDRTIYLFLRKATR